MLVSLDGSLALIQNFQFVEDDNLCFVVLWPDADVRGRSTNFRRTLYMLSKIDDLVFRGSGPDAIVRRRSSNSRIAL